MKPAPKPNMPAPAKRVATLTRWSRGPRLQVNRIRKETGCDVVYDFTGPDEYAEGRGITIGDGSVRERATTPSQELLEAMAKLDVWGRRVEES